MRLLEPGYLMLLPLLLGGVWWSRRYLMGMSRARKWLVLILRTLVVILLVLALAGPQAVQSNRGVCTIFVLDVSDSISDAGREMAKQYLKEAFNKLGSNDQAGLVIFGRESLVEFLPTNTPQLTRIESVPSTEGTDIASAIRLASALFPDGKNRRIVLMTDGNETQGSALDTASVARVQDIEIDVVALAPNTPTAETLLLETYAPDEVKIGEPFNLEVVVEAQKSAEGTLIVDRDGTPVKSVKVSLSPGKNRISIPIRTESEGFHRYQVRLEATPDEDPRNNIGRAFVRVQGKPRILLAEGGKRDPNQSLLRALRANNLEVVRVTENTFPTRADALQAYDAIILNDFPADALSPQMMTNLQSAVRDTGIGFAMIGGEKSFLPGGYYDTPIAEMLPVDLDVRQRKVFPPATVVIVIDISGSMAMLEDGIEKVKLAGKAAISALQMLKENDRFGVVVSGTGVEWLSPIQPVSNRSVAIGQISRIYAGGGGIYCRPSLLFAESALDKEPSRARHVILLADGNDCDEQEGCFEIAARMRAKGITMSVVSLGRGVDTPFLRQLAKVAGGQFYLTERARDLPRFFTADVSIMTRSAIEEGAFIPKVAQGEEVLQGINWNSTPPLMAYCLTSDRPLARTLMRTDKDDPLLAVWQYGLGTSLAFTSDAKPQWAQRWIGWSEFAPFWTQATRSLLRKGGKQDYQTSVRLAGGQAVVEMQAFTPQGEPINFLQPEVRISTPSGGKLDLQLQQVAPGKYSARFPIREMGDYLLTILERDPDGSTRVRTSGFSIPYPTEYRFSRANSPLIHRIAEITGGQVDPAPDQAFRPVQREGRSVRELWQNFLWLALALMLVDITVRRVFIPIAEWLALLQAFLRRVGLRRRAPQPASETVLTAQLLKVKGRTQRPTATVEPPTKPTLSTPDRTIEKPSPTATPTATTPQDTTSRLLELKRKTRR